MTSQTKSTLKGYFNTNDEITETNLANLIDTIGHVTLVVAANDASDASKGRADYLCDGTADDVQINAAIAALPSPGGTIMLSEGTFTLAASVVCDKSRVTIRGTGLYSTILQPSVADDPSALVVFGSTDIVHRCSLKDLWLYGRKDSYPAKTGKGLLFHANGSSLNDVNVTWFGGDGVTVDGAGGNQIWETFISNLTIYYPGNDGLVVGTLCHDSVLDRVFIKGGDLEGTPFGRYGILYSGEGCIFNNCHSYYNQNHGFYADGNADSGFIQGGAYETNGGNGILLYLVGQGVVSGVWCYGNTGTDIALSWSNNIIVQGNVCVSSAGNSIALYEADTCTVSNNICKNATSVGIWIDENSDGSIVSANHVTTAGGSISAIGLDDSDNNWILDNKVNDTIDQTGSSTGNVVRTPS